MKKIVLAALTGLFAAAASPAGAATLVGDTIQCAGNNGSICAPASATVGTGPEFVFTLGAPFFSFDFSANGLRITPLINGFLPADTLVVFKDLNQRFTSVTYLTPPPTNFSASIDNGGALILSFNRVLSGLTPIDLGLQAVPAPAAVPETATWGMMIAGFGMMGAAMRFRRRSTTVTFA